MCKGKVGALNLGICLPAVTVENTYIHCKKSEDYLPQESGYLERADLKTLWQFTGCLHFLFDLITPTMRRIQPMTYSIHFNAGTLLGSIFLGHIIFGVFTVYIRGEMSYGTGPLSCGPPTGPRQQEALQYLKGSVVQDFQRIVGGLSSIWDSELKNLLNLGPRIFECT